jgi:anti-sigma factor RsiW
MKSTHPEHAHRCRDFLERLSLYLDGDLPPAARRTVEQHLADCPCCEEVLDSLRETVALCHEKGRPGLPKDVRSRARERVRALLADMDTRH